VAGQPTLTDLQAAYSQAIEDVKEVIRRENVDDPYAAATYINAIARRCSPHAYINRLVDDLNPEPVTASDGKDQKMSTYLTRVIQAKCANCRLRETVQSDILKRVIDLFTQRGWGVRGAKLLCQECVKSWE
jgi:hypothetical protein